MCIDHRCLFPPPTLSDSLYHLVSLYLCFSVPGPQVGPMPCFSFLWAVLGWLRGAAVFAGHDPGTNVAESIIHVARVSEQGIWNLQPPVSQTSLPFCSQQISANTEELSFIFLEHWHKCHLNTNVIGIILFYLFFFLAGVLLRVSSINVWNGREMLLCLCVCVYKCTFVCCFCCVPEYWPL